MKNQRMKVSAGQTHGLRNALLSTALLIFAIPVPSGAAEADRDVAVWAVHMGGFVVVGGDTKRIRHVDNLPAATSELKS
jgi:hypothetical protein